jgi:hypothetical protein
MALAGTPQNAAELYHLLPSAQDSLPLLHRVFFFLARRDIGGGTFIHCLPGFGLVGVIGLL